MTAIGVCAPTTSVVSSVDQLRSVSIWHVSTDGFVREIQRPTIVDEALFERGEAYFAPPDGEGDSWPAGRYVFEITRFAGRGSRFLALEFIPTNS